jgi:hypothetical protein
LREETPCSSVVGARRCAIAARAVRRRTGRLTSHYARGRVVGASNVSPTRDTGRRYLAPFDAFTHPVDICRHHRGFNQTFSDQGRFSKIKHCIRHNIILDYALAICVGTAQYAQFGDPVRTQSHAVSMLPPYKITPTTRSQLPYADICDIARNSRPTVSWNQCLYSPITGESLHTTIGQ